MRAWSRAATTARSSRVVAVPRATLDRALAGLGSPGWHAAGVDMASATARPSASPAPGCAAPAPQRSLGWLELGPGCAVALIALAAGLWQMLDNRENRRRCLRKHHQYHSSQADRVRTEKKQLVNLVEA